jgi:CSLREA domain-containing protein
MSTQSCISPFYKVTAILLVALLLLTGLPVMTARAATTLIVNTLDDTNDGVCSTTPAGCSLREAVANAVGGDTIQFSVTGVMTVNSQISLDKNLTITGPGASSLTLVDNGTGTYRLFYINNAAITVNISNLTIDGFGFASPVLDEDGGAIYKGGLATLNATGVIFKNNTAYKGGAFYSNTGVGSSTFTNCTFDGNATAGATGGGGAIFTDGALTVTNSYFKNNHTLVGSTQTGGAIRFNVSGSVTGSTFESNSSEGNGGAINIQSATPVITVDIINSTFYGNTTAASGGGLYVSAGSATEAGSIANIRHSTFSANTAGSGQGGSLGVPGGTYAATVNFYNTIIAIPGSAAYLNCAGTGTMGNLGGNFQYPDATCVGSNVDPKLGPLADNGGLTHTMKLLSGSPAINAVTANCQPTDQRGLVRPIGANCDSGAYEVELTPPDTVNTTPTLPTNPTASRDATFTFTGTDNIFPVSALTFECQLDGASPAACTSPKTYTAITDGSRTFSVWAVDGDGNKDATPYTYTWEVDGTAPDTSITSVLPTNPTKITTASFSFTGTDNRTAPGSLTYECQLDSLGWAACSNPKSYPTLTAASHIFEVRAVDQLNNKDATPASYTWVVDTTEPNSTIGATKPANPAKDTAALFTFSATDNITPAGSLTFQCKLDSGSYAACTSNTNFGPVSANVSHTFYVIATDAAGNEETTAATYTWFVDTTNPDTTIDIKPALLTKSIDATFDFSGTDTHSASNALTFECSLDGGAYATCVSGHNFGPVNQGNHTFDVRSIDEAGNKDGAPAHYAWTVDITEPATTITSASEPANPTNVTSVTFAFSGTDNVSDPGNLTFECQLDSSGYSACATSGTQDYSSLGEGPHTFYVKATDEAGNVETSAASYAWVVDITAPETTITLASKPVNPTNVTSATFAFTASDNEPGTLTFQCALDTGAYGACDSGAKNYPTLIEGAHTFYVKATDVAGNTDATPDEYTWFVDLTPPTTTIDTKPASRTKSTAAVFAFSGTDTHTATVTFECSLNGVAFSTCTSNHDFGPVAAGNRTFAVRSKDQAGNVDATPASYNWIVDLLTQAPTLTAPAANAIKPLTTTVTYTLPETPLAGSVKLIFDNGSTPYTLTLTNVISASFELDPANVAASPNVVSGSNIPTGLYTVKLSYQDDLGNLAAIDDSANVKIGHFNITGNTGGQSGVLLAYEDDGQKTATSGTGGAYTLPVSYNWSGDVFPSLSGWAFDPHFKHYDNVISNISGQSYVATNTQYSISGSTGIAGVTLSYLDPTLKTVVSGTNGTYLLLVSWDWTGTVTPSKAGYTFAPVNRSYSGVQANKTGENYTPTATLYTISGNAGVAGAVLSYTDGTAKTTVANDSGNYSFTVSYNWSGTVTPSKTGYVFIPANRVYANVLANKTAQNFDAATTFITHSVGTYDGWILESAETSNKGGSLNSKATTFQLGDDALDRQYRAILSFSTASLPDNAVIQSVTLKIKQVGVPTGINPFKGLGGLLVDIRAGAFGGTGLAKTDFQAVASAVNVATFSKTPAKGWYSAIFKSTGNLMINKVGTTQLRLYFTKDDNDNRKADFVNFASGNAAVSTQPQLIITYSVPLP